MMIDHVIPDIKSQFPRPPAGGNPEDSIVWVQQDNARPLLINDGPEPVAAMSADGWDIRLLNQPANSPDTNVLGLVFFSSIQSLQDRTSPRSVDDLVQAVKEAWDKDPPVVFNRVWLSLQACLEQIMLAGGDNDYKLPHIRNGKPENAGTLSWQMECKEEAWAKDASALVELEAEGAVGGAAGPLQSRSSVVIDNYSTVAVTVFFFFLLVVQRLTKVFRACLSVFDGPLLLLFGTAVTTAVRVCIFTVRATAVVVTVIFCFVFVMQLPLAFVFGIVTCS